MPEDDLITQLQKKLSDLSDYVDDLWFQFTKKTGSSGNSIYGSLMQSVNYVKGVSGWALTPDGNLEANNGNFRGDITGATGTFSGTVNVGSLNIPDSATTASMHTDSFGNSWWGSNVANGISQALASITSGGVATFKNVLIGGATIQYQVTNAGIFSFGDGSDGAAVMDGSATPTGTTKAGNDYTLTRDVYWTDATMSTGTTLNPAGYRIFGSGTLTMNGTAVIKRNGNAGTNGGSAGSGPILGPGGAALADGYLKGSVVGADGGHGGNSTGGHDSPTVGATGGNTTNSIGASGVGGGAGGLGSSHAGGGAGSGGTATASNVKLIANWHLATLLDIGSTGSTVKFDNSAASGGGGGGGDDGGAATGGGGGGAGSSGGIVAIYYRAIVIGASASITANGGIGGNGAASAGGGNCGGGGGGAGGNGGQIVLVYNTLTNSGSLTASGGTKGTGGAKSGTGVVGSDGTNGSAGTIRQFQISF